MTHTELVARALRWVRVTLKYSVTIGEGVAVGIEWPDVLGFRWLGADTILVECKASRADFLRDAEKPFRRNPSLGMGRQRIYVAPPDMLTPEEMPQGWGLAVPTARGMRVLRKPTPFEERATRHETAVLHTLVQRVTDGWGRKVFGEFAPPLVDGDPHPTTAAILRTQRDEIQKLRDEVCTLRRAANVGETP